MDLNAFWQQNRRFVLGLAIGAGCVAGGWIAIDAAWGQDLARLRGQRSQLQSQIARAGLYTRADQDQAQADKEALERAVATLAAAVDFQSRPAFRVDAAAGSVANQYHAIVASTQAELMPLASRANLAVDRALGLPALSPTRDDEIERYLQGLDAVDRIVRAAVACEVARIDLLEIKLDPALYTRAGTSRLERTQVRVAASGSGHALARFLRRTQDPSALAGVTQALLVDEAEVLPVRGNALEARLTATFVIARLRQAEPAAD
ncbi:MAG: hypothetical protein EPO68_00910 [Planctomycetota bacterium]|nr:MAG: hypothetical protein EPO68_00910 [Planctomycetota bacterium]